MFWSEIGSGFEEPAAYPNHEFRGVTLTRERKTRCEAGKEMNILYYTMASNTQG